MIDVTSFTNGDLRLLEAEAPKAANVLQIQIGALEYLQNFGIDLEFFIDPNFQFQNESFKAYLVQRLAEHNVNVNQVLEVLERFVLHFTFVVGNADRKSGGFIT